MSVTSGCSFRREIVSEERFTAVLKSSKVRVLLLKSLRGSCVIYNRTSSHATHVITAVSHRLQTVGQELKTDPGPSLLHFLLSKYFSVTLNNRES